MEFLERFVEALSADQWKGAGIYKITYEAEGGREEVQFTVADSVQLYEQWESYCHGKMIDSESIASIKHIGRLQETV